MLRKNSPYHLWRCLFVTAQPGLCFSVTLNEVKGLYRVVRRFLASLEMTAEQLRLFAVILTVATLSALPSPVVAQSPLPPWSALWQEIGTRAAAADLLVVRVYYGDADTLQKLAAQNEPWEVNRNEGYAIFDVTFDEYKRLAADGLRVEVDATLTDQLRRPNVKLPNQVNAIPGYPCYRTVEEAFAVAEDLVGRYPALVTWNDIGDSWEKATDGGLPGYDLMVLRITNSAIPGPKPKLFAMSAIHAREYTTAELNARFAEYLLENYGTDPDVTWIVDYHEIHLLLYSNPDGRKQAETGLSWRKNTNEAYCSPTSTSRGADLNRNFDFRWGCCGGSSGSQCADTYRGPSAASEPEVQAIQAYIRSQFPDLRADDLNSAAPVTTTGVFLDLHSYSELVLWPWGFTSTPAPNASGLQTLGRKMAYFNEYTPQQSMDLYATDGATDDFAYGDLGLPAYTIELGTSFFQDCGTFENTIYPDNLQTLLYAAKVVREPYLLPSGPDALGVTVSKVGLLADEPVTLTATLDDTRYRNSNGAEPTQVIAAARYSIDTPPWDGAATLISMSPGDGAFDTSVETALAVVGTTGLGPGRHTLFVQGQDAAGNWGPVSAVFLYILDPVNDPVVSGYVRDAGSAAPLQAAVTAGDFSTTTDLAGYYTLRVISDVYTLQAQAPGYGISATLPVTLQQGQSLQQDFALYPTCMLWEDDVESGRGSWAATGAWAISAESAHSPSHAWSDSPGGTYADNLNITLTSPAMDLSGVQDTTLNFWHTYDLEDDYDYGYVEYSADNGVTWITAASFNGENQTTWQPVTVSLAGLDDYAAARFRFRLETDVSLAEDGWHIDDITLSGAGPACFTPLTAPTADFTSSAPVEANRFVAFTSSAAGTAPLYYTWDFGDGQGTATTPHPVYTYTSSGIFTATLLVTNSLGSAQASHPVTVTPALQWVKTIAVNGTPTEVRPVPVATGDVVTVVNRIRLTSSNSVTATLKEIYPSVLSLTGWDTTAGVANQTGSTLTWEPGALASQTWYTLSVGYRVLSGTWGATMLGDDLWVGGVTPFMIKDYRTFHHLRPQMTVTPQVIQAALHPGERVTPTLTVHNTGDAALTWTLSEQPPVSWLAIVSDTLPLPDALAPGANRAVSLVLDTAGMGAGVYTATLQVTGDDPATPSIPVEIRLTVCTAPAGIAIVYSPSAPQAGDVITFSGSLDQGTPPFAWSWTLGDGAVANGQSITHTYAVSGTYPVTLTITSACGSASTSRVLNVPGLAALAVQPEAIAQTVPPGATGTATVQLRNTGTAPLVWATTPPPVAWLAVAPQNGALAPGDGISLTLGFDAAGLSNGLYTTALVITSNDPERPGVTLPVTLTVTCIPATGVTLRQVTTSDLFTDTLVAFEAELAPTTLATPYSYTLNGGATQTGSLNPLPFDLIFDAAGTHTVTLAVWNCPAHAPVSDSLQVLVHARAAQMVVVAPPPAAPVYPGDTYTQTLVVSNTGTGMLAWSLVETPQTNWLSATPSDGVLTPQTAASVTLSVDATGMQPGSHPVTLTVAGNDPQRPATDVPLTLTVMSGPLTSIAATREPSAGDLYTDTLITWTVTLLPLDAARPYTYTLDGGLPLSTTGNTVSFTRTGEPTGAHTLVVAAWNPVMLQPLTETLHYAIVARPTGHNFRVYLPLVLR